ncbi:CBS domain protein [Tenacibaculum adriaticum]|uniref:CBS domain protein n=1 Tax=Tenacibaculum adriaticum TaxID=413713 RepID=A0A5S5DRV6_9FLAO|nr:CBS domain-containing protein [Tenacibaculum adriaticum]TYP97379.1 CBS domain protein [Tenacibaculum adriaticum]
MDKSTPVSIIMTTDLITVNYNDDLTTAAELFKSNNIRHIPVIFNDEILGMLSHTDLMRVSYTENIEEVELEVGRVKNSMFTIEQVMANNVVSVSPKTTIKEVAEILAKREFHALPVVEEEKLVGIVTTTDLIKYLLDQYL